MPPAMEAWGPNHWTAKEFPSQVFILFDAIIDEIVFLISFLSFHR